MRVYNNNKIKICIIYSFTSREDFKNETERWLSFLQDKK
jgi:hypothetical protein